MPNYSDSPDEHDGVEGHEDPEDVAHEVHDHDADQDDGEVVLGNFLSP